MGFILLRFWGWCCKSEGFRKKPEHDFIKQFSRRLEKSFVELSLKQFRHHTRQLTVTNPSFVIKNTKVEQRTANFDFWFCVRRGDSAKTGQAVRNWSFVLLFKFCASKRLCSPKPGRTQSPKTLAFINKDNNKQQCTD